MLNNVNTNNQTKILRGDIYYCNLQQDNSKRIQGGIRPCIIISNNLSNHYSNIVKIIPLTSKIKKLDLPCHTLIKANNSNGLQCDSMALAEQIQTIDKSLLRDKIGVLDSNTLKQVYYADLAQNGIVNGNAADLDLNIKLLDKCFSIINNKNSRAAITLLESLA